MTKTSRSHSNTWTPNLPLHKRHTTRHDDHSEKFTGVGAGAKGCCVARSRRQGQVVDAALKDVISPHSYIPTNHLNVQHIDSIIDAFVRPHDVACPWTSLDCGHKAPATGQHSDRNTNPAFASFQLAPDVQTSQRPRPLSATGGSATTTTIPKTGFGVPPIPLARAWSRSWRR